MSTRFLMFLAMGALLAARAVPAAAPRLVLEAGWGKGPGQMGYYNHTVKGFEESKPLGPMGLALGPEGEIVIADTYNDRIHLFDANGKLRKTLTGPLLKLPWTVAVTREADVIAALGEGEHILRLGQDGKVKAAFGGRGEEPGRFAQIALLRLGPTGLLFVGDLGHEAILALDERGREMADLEWQGNGLAIGREGTLLDLEHDDDDGSYAVRARRLDGEQRYVFTLPDGELEDARLLGVDEREQVYARFAWPGETGWLRAVRFTPDGKTMTDLGRLPYLPTESSPIVHPKGGLLWLDYDAAKAPAGKVRVFRGE